MFRMSPCATQHPHEWIPIPWFAEDGNAVGPHDPAHFSRRNVYIEVMQDRMTPNGIERIVCNRQLFSIGRHNFNVHIVGRRSFSNFLAISSRQVACRDFRTTACHNDRRHSVTATQIQDALALNVAELSKSQPYPWLMIEVFVVFKLQSCGFTCKRDSTVTCLRIVKLLFLSNSGRRAHRREW